jgi:Zn-finger nucleic acid-binding protein
MVIYEFEGVEIDHCLACGGTWFDAGELESLLERDRLSIAALRRELQAAALGAVKRRCPRCRRRLEAVKVGAGQGVELDRCSAGHGVWFDEGETMAVIGQFRENARADPDEGGKASGATAAGRVARFLAELYRHPEVIRPAQGERPT